MVAIVKTTVCAMLHNQKKRTNDVYAFLLNDCLTLRPGARIEIKRKLGIDDETIDSILIRSIPTYTANLVVCAEIAKLYGQLFDVEGFYLLRGCWLLDVDEKLSERGLIIPVRNRVLQIVALRVFRHSQDERPFILKTRRSESELVA